MPKCSFCDSYIEIGFMTYFWTPEEKTKPTCMNCFKKLLDSGGREIGLKNRLEKWFLEEKFTFTKIFEPNHLFHFNLKDFGPLKIGVEIFQDKNNDLVVGFMTFLSNELTFKIYKFSKDEKEDFKNKINDFLSTLRIDYRSGMRVGYEIVSDRGHYGAKYFIKTRAHDCNKEKILKMLEMVKTTGLKSEEFLHNTLNK